jgi:hypothetical protein
MTEIIRTHLPNLSNTNEVIEHAKLVFENGTMLKNSYLGAVLINLKLSEENINKFLSSIAELYNIELKYLKFNVFSELMIHLVNFYPNYINELELNDYIITTNKNNLSIINKLMEESS